MNNVVIVSGEEKVDSATSIHVFILPQTSFPSRLPSVTLTEFPVPQGRTLVSYPF